MDSLMDGQYSLLQQHLRLLGGEKLKDPFDQIENQRISNQTLTPLTLPSRRIFDWQKFWTYVVGPTLAVAATFSFFLYQGEEEPLYLTKGSFTATIYTENNGVVEAWNGISPIKPGNRFMVEVTSVKPVYSYLGFIDKEGTLLTAIEDLRASEMLVAAGESKAFAKSFRLTQDDQGEAALLLVCSKSLLGHGGGVDAALVRFARSKDVEVQVFDGVQCRKRTYNIR